MNNLSRFPGTTLRADRLEGRIEAAEDNAAAEFAPVIEAIERAQIALLELAKARPAVREVEGYLTDALADTEHFQEQARREAAASVRSE